MQPTEHALVGAAGIVAYWLARHRRLPAGTLLFAALAGSLLPDLVDKPLAWSFGFVPSGRMVAHSLVIAVPLLLVVGLIGARSRRLGHAVWFTWGYLSHLAGDFRKVAESGADYYYFPNLFWPLLEASPDNDPNYVTNLPTVGTDLYLEVATLSLVGLYIAADIYRRQRAPGPR